jgi:hypothetical protein
MSELKRNADFARASSITATTPAAGIDQSQPWRTAEMQQAMERWDAAAEAGFDPYNHTGARVKKAHAA